jgi:hypothetical protein
MIQRMADKLTRPKGSRPHRVVFLLPEQQQPAGPGYLDAGGRPVRQDRVVCHRGPHQRIVDRAFDAGSATGEKTFERPLATIRQGQQPDFDRLVSPSQSTRNGFAGLLGGERAFEFIGRNKDFHGAHGNEKTPFAKDTQDSVRTPILPAEQFLHARTMN